MSKNDTISKLRLNNDHKILIINATDEFLPLIKELAFDKVAIQRKEYYDYIQIFATTRIELIELLKQNAKYGKYDCLFWACYPKGGGKIKSDIKHDTVWKGFESVNLKPVTQIALDETWSALRGRPHDAVGK